MKEKMSKIHITIKGDPQSGKTTIAEFIQKCLVSVGIDALITDQIGLAVPDEVAIERLVASDATFQPRLKALVGTEELIVGIATEDFPTFKLAQA